MSTPEATLNLSIVDSLVPSNKALEGVAYSQDPAAMRPGLQMLAAVLPLEIAGPYMEEMVVIDAGFEEMLRIAESKDYELAGMTQSQGLLARDAARLLIAMNVAEGSTAPVSDADILFTGFWDDRQEKGSPLVCPPFQQIKVITDALGGYQAVAESLRAIRYDRQARIDTIGAWIGSSILDEFVVLFGTEAMLQALPGEQTVIKTMVQYMSSTSQAEKNRLIDTIDSKNFASKASQLARVVSSIDSALGCVQLQDDWRESANARAVGVVDRLIHWREGYRRIQTGTREVSEYISMLELGRECQAKVHHERALDTIQSDAAAVVDDHQKMVDPFAPLSGKKLRSSEYWSLFGALTGHTAPQKSEHVFKPTLDKVVASEWIGNLHGLQALAALHQDDDVLRQVLSRMLKQEQTVVTEFESKAAELRRFGRRPQSVLAKTMADRCAELSGRWTELAPLLKSQLTPETYRIYSRLGLLLQTLDNE